MVSGKKTKDERCSTPKSYERLTNETLNEYIEKRKATYAKVKEEGPKKVIKDSGFKPGVKVIVQNPKTKRWDQEAVIVNQRSKRTGELDEARRHHQDGPS